MPTPRSIPKPYEAALKRATQAHDQSGAEYAARLIAGGSIRDALARTLAESDPILGQLRTERSQAQQRLGQVFSGSLDELKDISDPEVRERIRSARSSQYGAEAERIGGLVEDVRGDLRSRTESLGSIFDATTNAKQFEVEQRRHALERALGEKKDYEGREFESRFDDLNRRKLEADIAATNRSNAGGGSGLTFLQGLENPLAQFLKGGGKRIAKPDGGFDFVAPDGRKITVEEAAAMTSAGTAADFLVGSRTGQDQKVIADASGKPISAEASKVITSAQSGLRSLDTLRSILAKDKKGTDRFLAKLPFGAFSPNAQQYQNASRNVADVLARLRTGAQINREEEALYKKFVPGPFDTPESAQQKLETLQFIFDNLSTGKRPSAQELKNVTVVDTGV